MLSWAHPLAKHQMCTINECKNAEHMKEMGLLVKDSVQLPNGLELTDLYMTFGSSAISMNRVSDINSSNVAYQASTTVHLYVSKAAQESGSTPIVSKPFTFDMDPAPVFKICYDNLKLEYDSVEDA